MFPNLVQAALGTITAGLGESVEYRPTAGSPKVIKGVFTERYEAVDPETQVIVSTEQPNVMVRISDLLPATLEQDATVLIRTVVYKVYDYKKDGEGAVVLLLHKT